MRSIKHQILILLSSLVILMGGFFLVFSYHMKDQEEADALIKAQADLATCGEIIDTKYPGSWSVRNGELYKGSLKISFNNDIVDHLSHLTGDTVTIFQGEMRVATTARGSNGEREIGTKVSAKVAETVMQDGQTYLGEADVAGQLNQAGYVPLRAETGQVIGMFYVGISNAHEQEFFTRSLIAMAEVGLVLIVLIALLTWLFLKKVIIFPLRNIVSGPQEAAVGHSTQLIEVSCAQEIEEMKDAFSQMMEEIQVLTEKLTRATYNNLEAHSSLETHNNLDNNPPENEIHTVVGPMKVSEAIHELTIRPMVAVGLEPEFSLDSPWYSGAEGLPKGLSKVTLDHIIQFLQVTRRPLSAEEVAEGVKLTRVTVRHYLEFLEQRRVLKSELRYGTGGRPVKLFILL